MPLADLIESGKLRVAFNRQNVACIRWYQGPISGPCVDVAAELVGQMRVRAGGHVLADSITRIQWGVAVADGRADLLAFVTRFLDGAKSAGIVQDAIERHKVEGARVAR